VKSVLWDTERVYYLDVGAAVCIVLIKLAQLNQGFESLQNEFEGDVSSLFRVPYWGFAMEP
jgi:hypothetical protein